MLFNTPVGRDWLNVRFTALSLVYGPPPNMEESVWRGADDFLTAFRQIFDMDLAWTANADTIVAWIDAYAEWYAKEEHAIQATQL